MAPGGGSENRKKIRGGEKARNRISVCEYNGNFVLKYIVNVYNHLHLHTPRKCLPEKETVVG